MVRSGLQFVRHQLEVGQLVQREDLLDEDDGFWRPVRPMAAAGERGTESGGFIEETGAQPVQVGALIWKWWSASPAATVPALN